MTADGLRGTCTAGAAADSEEGSDSWKSSDVRAKINKSTRESEPLIINSAYLDDGSFTGDFEDLTLPNFTVFQSDVDNFGEPTQDGAD